LLRILIVDDHEIVRRGVRSTLRAERNWHVCGEAVDGRDAIQKAQELQPDVITMDISMPQMNGLDACREIRRALPSTKILMLTQYDIPEMMQQAANAGANGYVVKSAIATELVAALQRLQKEDSSASTAGESLDSDLQEILQRNRLFERALRETGKRLRLAQQVARVGTFEFDVRTGVNLWTPELESLYGLRPSTFSSTFSAWENLIHPEDRYATIRAFDMATETGAFEGEWRVIWPDGSVHWLLGRAWLFRDEEGNPERWVGANIDISDRKRSEEQAEKLARLLDISFDAIFLRDAQDRVRYWNRAAQELYGWSAEEAEGKVTHSLLKTVFPERLDSIFAVLRKEQRWEGELRHTAKDGRSVRVRSRWGLVRDWESGQQWVMETNTHIVNGATATMQNIAAEESNGATGWTEEPRVSVSLKEELPK
jgi:PAS domain S-box-containing protein